MFSYPDPQDKNKQHDLHSDLSTDPLFTVSTLTVVLTFISYRAKNAKAKSRIAHLLHLSLIHKITNPQEITNQFAEYYGALYNLQNEPHAPQLTAEGNEFFLHKLHLPSLSDPQLEALKDPSNPKEIDHGHSSKWKITRTRWLFQ